MLKATLSSAFNLLSVHSSRGCFSGPLFAARSSHPPSLSRSDEGPLGLIRCHMPESWC